MACHGMSWHVTISPCKFSDVFPFQAHVQCAVCRSFLVGLEKCAGVGLQSQLLSSLAPWKFWRQAYPVRAADEMVTICDNRTRINNGTQMTQKSLSFLIVWQCMTPGMRNWRSRKVGPMLFLCVPYASTENFGQYLTCLTSLEDRQRKNLQGSVWFRMVPW